MAFAHFPSKPWYRPRALLERAAIYLVIVLIGYLGLCLYLYLEQNSLEYPRFATGAVLSADDAAHQAHYFQLVPWDKTTPGSVAPQGYVRTDFATAPAPRGTIVLFHGNGGWAETRGGYADVFAKRGFRTFLYEYPGYGGRPGRPSEKSIVPDAQALVRSLDQQGFGPIYVWGESLGSGVSAAVCADTTLPIHGLVLLTAWDRIANVGLSMYPFMPVPLLMTDRYDSIGNLENFKHPICVVRSGHDEIIPPPLTLNLFAHLPNPKKMILHENSGHNDWPSSADLSWWDEALDFIAPR